MAERENIRSRLKKHQLTQVWLINQLGLRGIVTDKTEMSSVLAGTRSGSKADAIIELSHDIWYNEPKTLDVFFDVLGDIILATASQQYGGFTVPEVDKLAAPYAEKSYKKYVDEYMEIRNQQTFTQEVHEWAMQKVERDFEQGFQGIEMKLNTVGSSRGDYPFITMTFGLATDRFGKMARLPEIIGFALNGGEPVTLYFGGIQGAGEEYYGLLYHQSY